MRVMVGIIAVALVHVQAASGGIFENELHNGQAGASFSPPATIWQDANTRVFGSIMGQTTSSFVNWDIGLLEPTAIRLSGNGFASSLGSSSVSVGDTMTVSLTEASQFTLAGNMSTIGTTASVSARISGAGILGVPLEPDGSLLLSGALGSVSLSGTLLPGEYTIVFGGNASGGSFTSSGSFGANLVLAVVPAPAAATPVLAALVLGARRRRKA